LLKCFKNIIILILLFGSLFASSAQSKFDFKNSSKKQTLSFKLLNNLIVIPIEVNGKKLNFILDSGVGSTILFNLNDKDSIPLHNLEKIKLQGLGSEEPVDAILSKGNTFNINKISGVNQSLYVIFDDSFDLSSKLGITVHGIIGFELLKDFVVDINYSSKRIIFYDSETYEYKNCKKCEILNLELYKLKPYINVGVKLPTSPNKITPVKLLIDSGGSDAMWLFENSHPDILPPEKFFVDFLGEGLSGTVHGKRAKINALVIGKHELKEPTVSYPDSISISFARKFEARNGSMGASVLKRFNVTFDYKKQKIILKRNSSFKNPFNYNMSGIELVYNGKILVKQRDNASFSFSKNSGSSENNKIILDYKYKYAFKPSYKIFKVQNESPAFYAGLLKDDIIVKVNGKYAHEMKLEEIVHKFYEKENKKINLVVERNAQHYEFSFRLKDMLK